MGDDGRAAVVSPAHLRAFAQRDWKRVRDAKEAAWAELHETRGAAGSLELAESVTAHVAAWSDLTSDASRQEDLAAHIHLKRLIDDANARLGNSGPA